LWKPENVNLYMTEKSPETMVLGGLQPFNWLPLSGQGGSQVDKYIHVIVILPFRDLLLDQTHLKTRGKEGLFIRISRVQGRMESGSGGANPEHFSKAVCTS
jgi:hypothetical protein